MKKYNYNWSLQDANFLKNKGTVFSCFSGGGGSTMGYKLAGFDVLGCNEIDPKMMQVYIANHNPKYSYLEPIQTFKDRQDLPDELYNLDILDGSPPCSSFSMSGSREKDWGKARKFREGQQEQVLDTLFFDFIDLAKKLQPKVVVAENVKGLLMGAAKSYVIQIYKAFDDAGYYCQHWLLDASKMGVPQRRERVFFIALRKDLAQTFLVQKDMFTITPSLNLQFSAPVIPYSEIASHEDGYLAAKIAIPYLELCADGEACSKYHPKKQLFGYRKINPNMPLNTITAGDKSSSSGGLIKRVSGNWTGLNKSELLAAQTFPTDYNFVNNCPYYICGMSVPPVMIANIANQIHEQWLSKI